MMNIKIFTLHVVFYSSVISLQNVFCSFGCRVCGCNINFFPTPKVQKQQGYQRFKFFQTQLRGARTPLRRARPPLSVPELRLGMPGHRA